VTLFCFQCAFFLLLFVQITQRLERGPTCCFKMGLRYFWYTASGTSCWFEGCHIEKTKECHLLVITILRKKEKKKEKKACLSLSKFEKGLIHLSVFSTKCGAENVIGEIERVHQGDRVGADLLQKGSLLLPDPGRLLAGEVAILDKVAH